MKAREIIKRDGKTAIGMVHCLALPGAPNFEGDMGKVVAQAIADAKTLEAAGADAIVVENAGDMPFCATISKEETAALAAVTALVVDAVDIPVGVDAAFSDAVADIAVAKAAGAQFVRCPVFVDTIVNVCGVIEPCCGVAMRTKRGLAAEDIMILADVQVKHARMLLPEIPIEESAKNAVASGADAIIVTGLTTGDATPLELVSRAKAAVDVPVLVGSGVTADTIAEQLSVADGAIVGTSTKPGGVLSTPVDLDLARKVFEAR